MNPFCGNIRTRPSINSQTGKLLNQLAVDLVRVVISQYFISSRSCQHPNQAKFIVVDTVSRRLPSVQRHIGQCSYRFRCKMPFESAGSDDCNQFGKEHHLGPDHILLVTDDTPTGRFVNPINIVNGIISCGC